MWMMSAGHPRRPRSVTGRPRGSPGPCPQQPRDSISKAENTRDRRKCEITTSLLPTQVVTCPGPCDSHHRAENLPGESSGTILHSNLVKCRFASPLRARDPASPPCSSAQTTETVARLAQVGAQCPRYSLFPSPSRRLFRCPFFRKVSPPSCLLSL